MNPDFLVIGAGVAGLRAAIELAEAGSVLVVAKEGLRDSSSEYAQGGIAAAMGPGDSPELHEQDTLSAGDGLCEPTAVRTLVTEGPEAIRQLISWGAEFDRDGDALAFGREGAHSQARVLHARGDSTGHEIAQALYRKATSLPNVTVQSFASTLALLVSGEAAGAELYDSAAGAALTVHAKAVLLATGGLGRVFLNTTNPGIATGDGVAMAWRAGAVVSDLEFVQFHPTALAVDGGHNFLLSEALRGEGAVLRNQEGERFMERYHPMLELAPRDVVARAIASEMSRTGVPHVLLDFTQRESGFVRRRFPRIYETCQRYGIDLEKQPAPVHPAAHYAMGGVQTDLEGRTSIKRLFAAGEVAANGVHGANRLASNSLLEAVVFGARAGRAMRETEGSADTGALALPEPEGNLFPWQIQRIAWEKCGIVRDGQGLKEACEQLERERGIDAETENLRLVALLIARAALAREESRGAHFRSDFPNKQPEFEKHSTAQKNAEITFR